MLSSSTIAFREPLHTLAQLAELESTFANIMTYLKLTRDIVSEAFRVLQDELLAQVTLASIPRATRYQLDTKGNVFAVSS